VVLLAWAVVGWLRWRQAKRPELWVAWSWFLLPLLPVSQVLVPLQNPMADRYLWWSVMTIAYLLGLWVRAGSGWSVGVTSLVLLVFACGSIQRATLFGDSVLIFADATRKTRTSTVAPYQLGQAYEAQGREAEARRAYELVLARGTSEEPVRRATNNLARLEARRGNWPTAEMVLRRGLLEFPTDPKMRENLRRVLLRRPTSDNTDREPRQPLGSSTLGTFADH